MNYEKFKAGDKVRIASTALRNGGTISGLSVGIEGEVITPEAAGGTNTARSVPHVIIRVTRASGGFNSHWIQESCLELVHDPSDREIAALFGIAKQDEYSDALYDTWKVFSELVADPHFDDHVSLKFSAEFTTRLSKLLESHGDE